MIIAPTLIFNSCISSAGDKNSTVIIQANNKDANAPLTVIELFTSQGCSSCPAADKLMEKYINQKNVVVLSYHVDYWNRLGWTDPFSSKAFSQRQYEYARKFKLNGPYTPQLIINGEEEMIGSDEGKITQTLKNKLAETATADLQIKEVKTANGKIVFNYTITGNKNNLILNVALIQKKATTSIEAGENKGINLTNFNVVRNFKYIPVLINEEGTASIDMVQNVDRKDLILVTFIQDAVTLKVAGGTSSSL